MERLYVLLSFSSPPEPLVVVAAAVAALLSHMMIYSTLTSAKARHHDETGRFTSASSCWLLLLFRLFNLFVLLFGFGLPFARVRVCIYV